MILPFLLVELTIWLLCAQKDTSFQLGENGKKNPSFADRQQTNERMNTV